MPSPQAAQLWSEGMDGILPDPRELIVLQSDKMGWAFHWVKKLFFFDSAGQKASKLVEAARWGTASIANMKLVQPFPPLSLGEP